MLIGKNDQRDRIRREQVTDGPPQRPTYATYLRFRRTVLRGHALLWVIVGLAFIWGVWGSGIGVLSFITGLSESFRFIVVDALPPRPELMSEFVRPTVETLQMSIVGLIISVVLSIPVGILAARNTSPHWSLVYPAKAVHAITRAAPSLVITVFFVAVFGVGPLAGTLALGIGGIGILGKAYGEAIEEIDAGQIEGLRSTGAGWLQILRHGVWPQFKPAFVTWTLYRFERNIRGGAMLGLVGGGGLGFALISAINLYQFRTATTIILLIFALVLLIELATSALRRRAI